MKMEEVHDILRIGYLGLGANEVSVLTNIFTLSPQLKESYLLCSIIELDKADLVLVNVDNSEAVKQWNKIARNNSLVIPITISSNVIAIDGVAHLKLPIRLKKLVDALEDSINENTLFKNPDSGSSSGTNPRLQIFGDNLGIG